MHALQAFIAACKVPGDLCHDQLHCCISVELLYHAEIVRFFCNTPRMYV